MANCLITSGYDLSGICSKENVGGLDKIYIANWSDIQGQVAYDNATGEIDALGTGYNWFTFDLVKETSGFVENITANVQNGTLSFQPQVTLVMNKLDTDKRNLIAMLSTGLLVVIAKDNNDNYLMLGRVKGLDVTAMDMGSGTANADRNGVVLTLTGSEPKVSAFLDAASIAALPALATY